MQNRDSGRRVAAMFAICLAAQLCAAQGAPTADLKALAAKYEQGLAGIQTNADKAMQDWPQAYVAELKKVEQKLLADGDLEGVIAVRKEMERFGNEKAIPEDAVVTGSPVLRELQIRRRKVPETVEIDKSRQIVLLSRSHIAALEDLQKKLTIQGKIEEAIAAKDEAERVRIAAPVTSAEFVLANAGVTLTPDGATTTRPAGGTPVAGSDEGRSASVANVRASLVLWYSFDRDEGGKVTDKSGKGHGGKVHGAKWTTTGKTGGGFDFDGASDFIVGPSDASAFKNDEHTVLAWVKMPRFESASNAGIAGYWSPGAGSGYGLCYAGNGQLGMIEGQDSTWDYARTPKRIDDGKWHHLAGLRLQGKAHLFVDGVRQSGSTRVKPLFRPGQKFMLGFIDAPQVARQHFEGTMDEVMVFDRALTEKEIKQIYDAQK